jgi:glutamate N-acetyltransferase/amino-acid N-acetyltransferase
MPVNLVAPNPEDLHLVAGVEIGTAMAGVRKANRRDLTVFKLAPGSTVAGVFTRNRFCAAPVQVCREHLAGPRRAGARSSSTPATPTPAPVPTAWPRAPHLRRAGDAAGPGAPGGAAVLHRRHHGDAAGGPHRGRPAGGAGRPEGPTIGPLAAEGIMTTDTLPKAASRQVRSAAARSRSPASPRAPA